MEGNTLISARYIENVGNSRGFSIRNDCAIRISVERTENFREAKNEGNDLQT